MIKKMSFKLHEMYEVWNEYAAESIYFHRKPTDEELFILAKKNRWLPTNKFIPYTKDELMIFIKKWIRVGQMKNVWFNDNDSKI